MDLNDILAELDILSETDFRYPEQFIALMETDIELDYDTFTEIILMASREDIPDMLSAFFEDLIRGIPDDDTALYATVQSVKDMLATLSSHMSGRGTGFFIEELFRFRTWYKSEELIQCTPEEGGASLFLSPLEALMLYREEKLSGTRYRYDYTYGMPEGPDEYVSDLIYELENEEYNDSYYDNEDDLYDLPEELPEDFDPSEYDPDQPLFTRDFDPYRDGFIDRFDPVIEGEDLPYKKVGMPSTNRKDLN